MASMPLPPMPMGAGGAQGATIGTQGQPAPTMPGASMMPPPSTSPTPQKLVEDFMSQVHELTLDIQALAGQYDAFAPTARAAIETLQNGITPVVNSIQGAETPPSPAVAR